MSVCRSLALAALLLGLAAAPAHAGPAKAACSAAGLSPTVPDQAGLPPAVAQMRREIVKAAVRCDFKTLEKLAKAGPEAFTYTYGLDEPPATVWQKGEKEGYHPLATLVKLLNTPFVKTVEGGKTLYVWPTAYAHEHVTDQDIAHLKGIYPPDALKSFKANGYLDYRVGITEKGDWLFFVAGD